MLRSWSEPFREAHSHRPDVRWYELSLVESVVSHPGSSISPYHTLNMKARTLLRAALVLLSHRLAALCRSPVGCAMAGSLRRSGRLLVAIHQLIDCSSGTLLMQVMSFWPFKQMIIKSGAQQQQHSLAPEQAGLQPEPLFSFGDATEIRKALNMTNRLTGYTCSHHGRAFNTWCFDGAFSEMAGLHRGHALQPVSLCSALINCALMVSCTWAALISFMSCND